MKSSINLLPASYRRQLILRKRMLQWAAMLSAVLFAGWCWHWYKMHEHRSLLLRLEVLQNEHEPTQSMLRQLVEMRQKLLDLQHQQAIASELERQRNALKLLSIIGGACQKTNGRLRVTKLEVTEFQRMGAEAPAHNAASEPGGVLLTGDALDNAAVLELLETLEQSGIFGHVELIASTERDGDDSSLRDYRVSCQF